jgi:hypothetical protein
MFAGYSVNKCMWNGSDVYNKCWEKSESLHDVF